MALKPIAMQAYVENDHAFHGNKTWPHNSKSSLECFLSLKQVLKWHIVSQFDSVQLIARYKTKAKFKHRVQLISILFQQSFVLGK